MSRSYKKFPLSRMSICGRNSMKKGKQMSNRKIRRKLKNPNIDVGNGKHYRAFGLDSWDLWEYQHYMTERDVINRWEIKQKWKATNTYVNRYFYDYNSTLEEDIQNWKKSYMRKQGSNPRFICRGG